MNIEEATQAILEALNEDCVCRNPDVVVQTFVHIFQAYTFACFSQCITNAQLRFILEMLRDKKHDTEFFEVPGNENFVSLHEYRHFRTHVVQVLVHQPSSSVPVCIDKKLPNYTFNFNGLEFEDLVSQTIDYLGEDYINEHSYGCVSEKEVIAFATRQYTNYTDAEQTDLFSDLIEESWLEMTAHCLMNVYRVEMLRFREITIRALASKDLPKDKLYLHISRDFASAEMWNKAEDSFGKFKKAKVITRVSDKIIAEAHEYYNKQSDTLDALEKAFEQS